MDLHKGGFVLDICRLTGMKINVHSALTSCHNVPSVCLKIQRFYESIFLQHLLLETVHRAHRLSAQSTELVRWPCKTSKTKLSVKTAHSWKIFTIFVKSSILDVWHVLNTLLVKRKNLPTYGKALYQISVCQNYVFSHIITKQKKEQESVLLVSQGVSRSNWTKN